MTELEEIAPGMEEVPATFPQSPVEIVLHQAGIDVRKLPLPNGQMMTRLQFLTPAFTITVPLDDAAAEAVSNAMRPSGIEIARVLPK